MSKRKRYLDLKVPNSLWQKRPAVFTFPTDDSRPIVRSLLGWNPTRSWYLRVTNSHSREAFSCPIEEVHVRYDWLIVIVNPYEGLDHLIGALPAIMATTIIIGAMRSLGEERKETVDDEQRLVSGHSGISQSPRTSHRALPKSTS